MALILILLILFYEVYCLLMHTPQDLGPFLLFKRVWVRVILFSDRIKVSFHQIFSDAVKIQLFEHSSLGSSYFS